MHQKTYNFSFVRVLIITLFLVTIHKVSAQNCDCTIDQVINNQVASCNITIGTTVVVTTVTEFRNAITQANSNGGNMTILIADGTYQVASTSWYPYITASDLVIRSQSGNRDAVILTGTGMQSVSPGTEIGLSVVGDRITIADLTIRDVGNHGISTQGDHMYVHNVKIQNTFEQMIKGTSAGDGADSATVQCCLLEYPAGVGPQFYIGGLDIHEGEAWLVRDNVFKNIASPSQSLAEHAVHFWSFSAHNIVERNWIINCDRGIGFGLGSSPNEGGMIRNNMIYNDGSGQFHDVGIGLESSPNTQVYNNTIFIEYPNAIEYRFTNTTNTDIVNNLTNQNITSRNGGQANLNNNVTDALPSYFVDVLSGDLHLDSPVSGVADAGMNLSQDVIDDFDQGLRDSSAFDIGAHEFATFSSTQIITTPLDITIYPNPFTDVLHVDGNLSDYRIKIFDSIGQEVDDYTGVAGPLTIDLTSWGAGVFYIAVEHLTNNELRVFTNVKF